MFKFYYLSAENNFSLRINTLTRPDSRAEQPNIVYLINKVGGAGDGWAQGQGAVAQISVHYQIRQSGASTHCESIWYITKDKILM